MIQKSIATTLVRLFAIGLIVYALRNSGMAVFFMSSGRTEWSDFYMLFTGIAGPVILACLLWIAPARVVGLPSSADGSREAQPISPQTTFSIGVALIGLYLAVTALAFVFEWFLVRSQQNRAMGEQIDTFADSYQLYSEILLLAIGLLFFFGASGIGKVFSFLRNYGIEASGLPDTGSGRTHDTTGPEKSETPVRGAD